MNWLCKLFGHQPERLPDTEAENGWWYENYRCKRCGNLGRQLVASQEG